MPSKKTKLWIITVTYNDNLGLQKTLASLKPLVNSKIDWGHIIVDSSPTENKNAIKNLPKNWPIFHEITTPEGIYAAHNAGINYLLNTSGQDASQNLVWFLNGGDGLYSIESLEKIIQIFEAYTDKTGAEIEMLYAAARLYRDQNYLYSTYPSKMIIKNILGSNHICHQATIYRLGLFKNVGVFNIDFKLASDYEHHWRCYLANIKTLSLPIEIVNYDMSGESSRYQNVFEEFKAIQRKTASQLPSHINIANETFRNISFARVKLFKFIGKLPGGATLRKLWLALK
jgi:hypothetical protein